MVAAQGSVWVVPVGLRKGPGQSDGLHARPRRRQATAEQLPPLPSYLLSLPGIAWLSLPPPVPRPCARLSQSLATIPRCIKLLSARRPPLDRLESRAGWLSTQRYPSRPAVQPGTWSSIRTAGGST